MDNGIWPAFPVTRGSDLGAAVWLGPSQLGHDAIDVNNVSQLPASRTPWDPAEHAAPGTSFVTPEQFLDCLPVTVRMSMMACLNDLSLRTACWATAGTATASTTASLCPDLRAPSRGTRGR
ncbi:hypothetical protein [Amycolatopsis sp. MJM2582]|uniref:hypothetical protein n=1 Tax=Amycolatopsis sp. MJM2582 TaxID=1427749 RepID=UPI00126A3AAD|nr:hypothetical protein [Amycolatopsis sp. MJM2582]